MCGVPDLIKPSSSSSEKRPSTPDMDPAAANDLLTSLLELAANDDVEGFKRDPSAVDDPGFWYCAKKGSAAAQMVPHHRTPLMVAATYGSVQVLRYILSISVADVNRRCGPDNTTALHCAASGASIGAVEAVRLLLVAGADADLKDDEGHRPRDVIAAPRNMINVKVALEELLGTENGVQPRTLTILTGKAKSEGNSPPLSSSPDGVSSPSSGYVSSPTATKFQEKKEYPIDPSIPDIKNSIYSTDEFRMFSFKVRPCSRAYSHDWTECPFVHPGENARRRDPRKFHYSCVPCSDFRKGACRRGDLCEYAHGVFECWLHPAQYRTRQCKDGTSCNRRVCFFAHTSDELRPLYVSTGSAVPSPRSSTSAAMELAAAMNMLPCSPSSMIPPFTPPISPSAGNGHNSMGWQQPSVPTLHLPGSNLQASRLRSALNARDLTLEDMIAASEFDAQQQLLKDIRFCNGHTRLGGSSIVNRLGSAKAKSLTPSNLEDMFSAEIGSSPRYNNSEQSGMFSPSQQRSSILNQLQQQQGMLSPIHSNLFSPKAMDPQQLPSALLQASLGMPSPGIMSPRGVEPISPLSSRLSTLAQCGLSPIEPISPLSSRLCTLSQCGLSPVEPISPLSSRLSTLAQCGLSPRNIVSNPSPVVGSPINSNWRKWGSPSGTLDWGVNSDEVGRLRRSNSFELPTNGEEPDLSWVHSLVKESPTENKEKYGMSPPAAPSAGTSRIIIMPSLANSEASPMEGNDHAVIGAWLEHLQLDQMVVQ